MTEHRIFSNRGVDEILEALDKSSNVAEFFQRVDDIHADPLNRIATDYDLTNVPNLSMSDIGGVHREVHNGISLFEHFRPQDPVNAADRRLWTYLALITFREYMDARWPLKNETQWKSRAKERWVMRLPNRRSLVKHGIARLWWLTSLTYDETGKQPLSLRTHGDSYAYTRVALSNEDRIQSIFERELGSSPEIMRAILESLVDSSMPAGDAVKKVTKEVTLVSGYRELTSLSSGQLREALNAM